MRKRNDRFPYTDVKKLRRVGILCHRHADADAYLSAYSLSKLMTKLAPKAKVDVIVPEGMTALTDRLKKIFPHDTVEEGEENEYDLFIAVDIGHTELLKDWLGRVTSSEAKKVLIDHHPIQKDSVYDKMLVDADASSTAELVYRLFGEFRVEMDAKTAQALLTGILFDSQQLAIAGEETLRACVDLIDHGAELRAARASLRSPPDYGEVVAKLKGARRSRFYRVGGWVVATSTVGSFQAHVARALVSLGADVAVVAGDFEEETRASLRSNQRFYESTGIHLGTKVAEVVPKETGFGGGHATAASFSCKLGEEKAVEKTLALIGELLGAVAVEIK